MCHNTNVKQFDYLPDSPTIRCSFPMTSPPLWEGYCISSDGLPLQDSLLGAGDAFNGCYKLVSCLARLILRLCHADSLPFRGQDHESPCLRGSSVF